MAKVFISYRRDDSADIVDRIYEFLSQRFGEEAIFMDVADIPLGVNFKTHLENVMALVSVALIVIGRDWVSIRDSKGQRRLDDPADFVRIEVETALNRNIPVIPVLVRGESMPSAVELPQSLMALAYYNGTHIRRNPDFYADMDRLAKALEQWIPLRSQNKVVGADLAWLDGPTVKVKKKTIIPGTVRVDSKGTKQVWVPGGCFRMGSDPNIDESAASDEKPIHEVCILHGFWLDAYPVTNSAYALFIADRGYLRSEFWSQEGWEWLQRTQTTAPVDYDGFLDPEQPRVGISWHEAAAYARWRGGQLPTEAEWEYAARGPDSRIYPWGNVYKVESAKRSTSAHSLLTTCAVGIYENDRSWVGADDMAGNVLEWCADWYDARYYDKRLRDNPPGPGTGTTRVMRGGSWDGNEISTRAASRRHMNPVYRTNYVGVRVVIPVQP